MRPSWEAIKMPNAGFPARAFLRSSKDEDFIYVHPHWHSVVEILFIIKGSAAQQINERIFNVDAGSLVIIPSDQIHSTYTGKDEKNEILVIQFDSELCRPSEQFAAERRFINLFNDIIEFPNPIPVSVPFGKEAASCLMEIYNEICEAREGYELFVKSYILKFIGIAVRHFGGATKVKEAPFRINRAKDMLKNTFRLIDESYSQELTLEQAVKASNFSVPHFCRLFRKFTGMTFGNYLAFYRVNRAEELLATPKSVTEIAYECGFGSLASFIRAFKRYKGLTPHEHRSGLKQKKSRNV